MAGEIRALDARFVPRELYVEKHAFLHGRVDELGQRVIDVEAAQTRQERAHEAGLSAIRRDMTGQVGGLETSMREQFDKLREDSRMTWRTYVAPIFTGAVVAAFTVLLTVMVIK